MSSIRPVGHAVARPVARPVAGAGPARRPLLVTADAVLLDEVLRLAAAGPAEVEVAGDAVAARRSWAASPLVLVGTDLSDPVAAGIRTGALVRRPGVVLVSTDLDDGSVWQRAVQIGAEHVACLPDAEPWLVDRLGRAAEGPGRQGTVLAVVGGSGGAGATVLATALAMAGLRRGLSTMLVDADPLGGGIDLVVGADSAEGVRWPALAGTRGRLPAGALQEALPAVGELTVLSWDRADAPSAVPAEAVAALLEAARAGSDLVVVDLPRHLDDGGRVVLAAADRAYLVLPGEVRACAAAARVLAVVSPVCGEVHAVVRRTGPRLPAQEVCAALGVPLAGALRAEPGLADCLARGEPPGRGSGPLARLCDRLVADVGAGRRGRSGAA